MELRLFWILDDINEAGAMKRGAQRLGHRQPADLEGQKLGVPFVSTTHFHTMFALEQWGIKAACKLLNMQPNQIAAAWERGDIDAATCGIPRWRASNKAAGAHHLRRAEQEGAKATFDGIAVQKKWGETERRLHGQVRQGHRRRRRLVPQQPGAVGRRLGQRQGDRFQDRRRGEG